MEKNLEVKIYELLLWVYKEKVDLTISPQILFLAEEMLFQLISSPTQRERGNISKYLVCHILSFSSKLHILSRVATKLVLSWDILHFARQTWQSWLQLEYQTVEFCDKKTLVCFKLFISAYFLNRKFPKFDLSGIPFKYQTFRLWYRAGRPQLRPQISY